MSKLLKSVEIISNILIVIVAILLIIFLVKYFLFSSLNNGVPKSEILRGDEIPIFQTDFSKSDKTLILVISTTCHFCSESANFYKQIVERSEKSSVQIIAVLPQKQEEGKNYLKRLGISINEVRQQNLNEIKVSGTPTLILLDNKGKVINSWVGKLSLEKEREVLSSLLDNSL